MIEVIYKGIIIGIIVSAPMGPIGILCVQRTLSKGRMHGFVTGMGAMFSDLIYASITLIGMGFVDDLMQTNRALIQFIGSIVIILFGVVIFSTNPLKILQPTSNNYETRYYQDFATAFLLTLSNVAIIFLFISLYARFQYSPLDKNWFTFAVGITSIGVGALVWWTFITTYVSKLKRYFNRQSLKFFNRMMGIILMLLGVLGIVGIAFFNL
ncbi:MAG: LysE family transporter [Dysgonamonadaceae bacterium]|jgi:threonine/homoserine/homoserine lactone efflux protein|nr:LysE family transporter [Dysgonamonadaceae bacterium]MDD3726785.1 LysE family transporter [Dysgonamonadaceae bacterium]MDD4247078.1 LysE family transporter [Dysgonamonadaceae bacterium]MDD4605253.1 LysE family transporter [Dysgonamonadaceae bacterium]HUI33516.1 LysE family transporter [Dysgonamonadaceae bacterium]